MHTPQTLNIKQSTAEYFTEQIHQSPQFPQLPLNTEHGQAEHPRAGRRQIEISPENWANLESISTNHNVSPSIALATCFGIVLGRWSNQSQLRLIQPISNQIIDGGRNYQFLDIFTEDKYFYTLVKLNQQSFATNRANHQVPRWTPIDSKNTFETDSQHTPVVFHCHLKHSLLSRATIQTLSTLDWGITLAPQIGLNHLAYKKEDASVILQWDADDVRFPTGLIDAMFESYVNLVRHLCANSKRWKKPIPDLLPSQQRRLRAQINASDEGEIPQGFLHDKFFRHAKTSPNAIAVIHNDTCLSYAQLAEQARRCTSALIAYGVQPGDTVAISMHKGVGQIIAALGILYAGAIYVPVAADQPQERKKAIYDQARISLIIASRHEVTETQNLTTAEQRLLFWQDAVQHEPLTLSLNKCPDDPAYIIYTSGSTGSPKGVCISHRAALNTCETLNLRYDVKPSDRVLALSGLHFDLSVYDIFGLFSTGGAIVLVDEDQRRDPSVWYKAIQQNQVTLWNSVPTLFDMLLTYCEAFNQSAPQMLRTVLLSGDWIGLDLPARYRAFRPDGRFVAMGGATEASIWSNVYDVHEVSPNWRSIPYGYPLAQQKYRVVDSHARDCPDWVTGELWIGGAGVALGYFNDPERTKQNFVTQYGERWYRTGDFGRYWPDGKIEFLGRQDKQVKIAGYRIELGEIEVALTRIPDIKSAITLAIGVRDKTLIAIIVSTTLIQKSQYAPKNTKHTIHQLSGGEKDKIMTALRKTLPDYMVPKRLFLMNALPLTTNGKVDRLTLSNFCTTHLQNRQPSQI